MPLVYLQSRQKPSKKSHQFSIINKSVTPSTTKLIELVTQSKMDKATYHINNLNNFVKFEELCQN